MPNKIDLTKDLINEHEKQQKQTYGNSNKLKPLINQEKHYDLTTTTIQINFSKTVFSDCVNDIDMIGFARLIHFGGIKSLITGVTNLGIEIRLKYR